MSDANLNDLERRLTGWRPTSDGLDADAMLFAAGRASVRRSPARFSWPAIAASLAVAVGILGSRLANERLENQALLVRLTNADTPVTIVLQAPTESSYLAMRRSWERDPDGEFRHEELNPGSESNHPILRAGERNSEFK